MTEDWRSVCCQGYEPAPELPSFCCMQAGSQQARQLQAASVPAFQAHLPSCLQPWSCTPAADLASTRCVREQVLAWQQAPHVAQQQAQQAD